MKTRLFLLVLVLQTLLLLGLAGREEFRLRHGTVVRLETVPVDPRDLLRGDYVILSYRISSLRRDLFVTAVTNNLPAGTPVYVTLKKSGEFYEAVRASLEAGESTAMQPVLLGKVTYGWWPDSGNRNANETVRVEYGLERYYVREGTGGPRGKLTVDVSVPPSGHGVIKQVYVGGVPYAEAMRDVAR